MDGALLYGLESGGTYVSYEPDADYCLHGIRRGLSCNRCHTFLRGIEAPEEHVCRHHYSPNDLAEAAEYVLTRAANLDVTDPQETRTPERYVKALSEMTTPEPFSFTTFKCPEDVDEMIVERDIPFHSLCRHHILPFVGVAHVGYVPNEIMAGLSKIPRTVKYHAAALQTQEELTSAIARDLYNKLENPVGLAVVMEAEHMCMTLRGVLSPGTRTYTAKMMGVFADHNKTAKAEFMARINGK